MDAAQRFWGGAPIALACCVATPEVAQSSPGAGLIAESAPPRVLDTIPARAALEQRGVRLIAEYKAEASTDLTGGERRDAALAGQFTAGVRIDSKVFGFPGGVLQAITTVRHGRDLGRVAGLDLLEQAQEVYGRGNVGRLTELSYQQALANGRVVLKLGRMPAGDFASFSCEFSNLSFCGAAPGNVVSSYWLNYPLATWAGWAKLRHRSMYLKLGVEEDNPNNLDQDFFASRRGARALILHGEGGWTPLFGSSKLPGRYVVGVWRSTVPADAAGENPANSRPANGRGGLYVQVQQQLTGSATEDPISGAITRQRGLNVFATVVRADRATSRLSDQWTAGMVIDAPLMARPNDFIGLAIAQTRYDQATNRQERIIDPAAHVRGTETTIELLYSISVERGLTLRPNLQYVINPGGVARRSDIVLPGMRLDLKL